MTTDPHLADTIAVKTAIARLEDFVAAHTDGALPSVDDLRLVIEAAKRGADVVEVRGLE